MNSKTQLPKRVTIELTNRCNRFCKECPRNKMKYPLGDMKWKLFTSVISQLSSSTVIVPFFRGEPVLYPRFEDAIKELQRFKSIQIATNGDFINERTEKALLSCSFVSISLHSFVYPHQVRKEILTFLLSGEDNGVSTQISILDSLVPESEKPTFIGSWKLLADRVRIYVEHSHNGFGSVGNYEGSMGCQKPFEEMVVYWDGKVALCNHDWDTNYPLGDLNHQTVQQVWNGQPYEEVRTLHNDGGRCRVESCRNCDYWLTSYLENKMFGELYTN